MTDNDGEKYKIHLKKDTSPPTINPYILIHLSTLTSVLFSKKSFLLTF